MKTYIKGIPLTWDAPRKNHDKQYLVIVLSGVVVFWFLACYGLVQIIKLF